MALQPTNAGINYQQRIAAQFLALMLTDSELTSWLPDSKGTLAVIHFESSDEIDDLVLENTEKYKFYLQIKRTVSLSDNINSQFYKVVNQFVCKYLADPTTGKYYLALSSESSGVIHNRLRRILNNIRRSEKIINLYLNESDQNVLNTFFSSIRIAYKNRTGEEIDDINLLCLCLKIHIVVYDLEKDMSGERACKLLLASFNSIEYETIWSSLIVDALEFATNRSIVTRNYIHEKYTDDIKDKKETYFFKSVIENEVQIGYDIILGHSPELLKIASHNDQEYDEDAFILLQLYRFDEQGKKQNIAYYPNNLLTMAAGIKVDVIHRCSSINGMFRFIETFQFDNKSMVTMLGNGDGQEDEFPEAQLHKKWVTEQLSKDSDLYCIHCREPLAGENCFVIEIDNISEKSKIGYAHVGCTRPIDRVLGLINGEVFHEYSYLKGFDYAFWSKAKGQRLFEQFKALGNNCATILWNPDIHMKRKGRFCIKVNLENGDHTYVTQRGYVIRGSHINIEAEIALYNQMLKEITNNDELGFTSISNMFGSYSFLSSKLEIGEEFKRCISFELAPYTSEVYELYEEDGDYYCPLVYLEANGSTILVDDFIFMLSNPLELEKYLKNWEDKIGLNIVDYSVVTLKHDMDFDIFIQDAIKKAMKVVVDPWFGNKNDFVRGLFIESLALKLNKEEIPNGSRFI